ncbi:MAG: iron transporter [Pseudorhodoferax sp.]
MSARLGRQIAGRVLAAALGGYALSALAMADLALLLPRVGATTPAEAVLVASLCSFVVYTGMALWVFATRSAGWAWLGLCGTGLLLASLFLGLR